MINFCVFSCIQVQLSQCHILLLSMSAAGGEQEETIEFYKIQLMEKDREIADFTAKMKKVEFKHSRQIKQAKMAKDRADALLKDEKARSDKYSKSAMEHAHKNQVLELRLAQLKRDKQKELGDISSKYNSLKEEVRSYQRILPTFTFLQELALTIYELPNYEDLFLTAKEKSNQCQRLAYKHKQAEEQWQQMLKSMRVNEQMLKSKHSQAEKNLKEVLAKLLEYEHQTSDLRLKNEQLAQALPQIQEQLQLTRERCDSLEESVRDYEAKMERLAEQFEAELLQREGEVYRSRDGELVQLQQQLRGHEQQLQRKEAMFREQIRILQQEIAYLNNKYQSQVDNFEEHYLTLKQQTERMHNEMTAEKRRYDELQQRYQENIQNFSKISILNERTEDKNKLLEQKITILQQKMGQNSKDNQETRRMQIEDMLKQYEQTVDRLNVLSEHYTRLEEERDHLQEENFILREELSSNQFNNNQSKSFLLQLPRQTEQRIRKKSSEIQTLSPLIDYNKQERISINSLDKTAQLQKKTIELQARIQVYLKNIEQSLEKEAILEQQSLTLKNELQMTKKEREKFLNESIGLKQKIIALTRANNQHQKFAYGNSTKTKLERSKVDSLQQQLKHLNQDNKREKQANKKAREQLKIVRQAHAQQITQLNKQVKQITAQIQSVKGEKQKLRVQLMGKEKSLLNESALLKSSKEMQQMLKEQIKATKQQKYQLDTSHLQLQDTLLKSNDQIIALRKQTDRLQSSLKQALRQNQLNKQSLQRQRKERSLLAVPSLQSIGQESTEQTFNQIYSAIPQKQGEINLLQRQMMDLKEQLQTLRVAQHAKVQAMQYENNEYVQTIIEMKMRCAQSEMRASQKEYLYSQLKKKAAALSIAIK